MSAEPGAPAGLRARLSHPVDCAVATAFAGLALAGSGVTISLVTGGSVPGLAGLLAAAAAIGVLAGYAVSGSV